MTTEFFGYLRKNNSVGIRNYVGIISDMDNVNPIASAIAAQVQGTVLITDLFGRKQSGINYELRFKAMSGLGSNPNLAAVIVVGLHQPSASALAEAISKSGKAVECIAYQDIGSTLKCIESGVRIAVKLVKKYSAMKRTPVSLSKLKIGTECGGSDFSSGIAGNPAIGKASDRLIDEGGTTVLSETAEVMGAEHILAKRAVNQKVADKIYAAVKEINRLAGIAGVPDIRKSNPSIDNQNGGITTLAEKSLGSIQKAGTRPLQDVLSYGDRLPLESSGFYFLNAPGPGCESMTAFAAGGAHLIVFNTGVGNPAANPVAPTIKITGNPFTSKKSSDDFDVDVSDVISNGVPLSDAGKRIFDEIVAVANGKKTVSEILRLTQSAISIVGASF